MTQEVRFIEESAKALYREVRDFIRTTPLNLMPGEKNTPIFGRPVLKYADGDDPFFDELKTLISVDHLTPREALANAYEANKFTLPDKLSVISWVLPIDEQTRKSNRKEDKLPSRLWSHTRWYGEKLNEALREFTVDILKDMGYRAVAPGVSPYLKMGKDANGPFSNWSERHIAFAAGQGTFGLSDGFISEKGIAHRCGSVVTDMPLPVSERTAKTPYGNCLFYFDGSCGKCIRRCPAGAISENGHDKIKCGEYLGRIGYTKVVQDGSYDLESSVAGCGLCQTDVPCEHHIPGKTRREPKRRK